MRDTIMAVFRESFLQIDDDKVKLFSSAQMVDGRWYVPGWGCDTMQSFINELRRALDERHDAFDSIHQSIEEPRYAHTAAS